MDVNFKCKWEHRWRAGWRWGHGLTWRGYDITGIFNTALCDNYSSIPHPHTQTHTWKLPILSLLNIFVSFVTQRWSSEVYFPHMSLWKPGFGLKKNTINHGIKIPYTYKFPLTTHALTQGQLLPPLDIENRKLDYMFNHQWLLNTDQIIKKARLYINNFLMQWLLMHRPYRLSIFKTWHDMCEVLRHSHGSVFSKVCWRLEEVKERVLLGWFNVKAA